MMRRYFARLNLNSMGLISNSVQYLVFFFKANPKWKVNGIQFPNMYLHSIYRSQMIVVKPISAVGNIKVTC